MNPSFLTHIVMDMESLGVTSEAAIVQFSAISYHLEHDAKKPLDVLINENSFNVKMDVASQIKAGRVTDRATLDWWKTLPPEAQAVLKPSPEDKSIQQFYDSLSEWLKSRGYNPSNGFTWTRGNIDILWLDSLWKTAGIPSDDYLIKWWKVRDIRTAVDVANVSSRLNGIPDGFYGELTNQFPGCVDHNSLHDCAKQVLQLRMANVF